MSLHIFTLDNGIRVVHQEVADAKISHCGLLVNVGSRDEKEDEQGLAHYIEHCLFKGTSKRRAFHILSGLDAVGGELNAYTTKENTTIYASFVNQHFEKAVELMTDITFSATFPEHEIHKEQDVIIDEINSYLDSPGEAIFDDFEEQLYAGHSIGRNILGTTESVMALTRDKMLDFVGRNFTTDRVVFSSVGPLSRKKLDRILNKHLASIPASSSVLERKPFVKYEPKHEITQGNFHQTHCVIGNVSFPANHKLRTAMVLLNNVLGGPAMNSRLNLKIREKYGFTYNIESSYVPYSDTGIFTIYYGTDKKFSKRTRDLIYKELKAFREQPLTVRQLNAARQQLIGQIALAQESQVNLMLGLGKSLLLFNEVDPLSAVFARVNSITAEELHEIANDVFAEDKLSSLTFEGQNSLG